MDLPSRTRTQVVSKLGCHQPAGVDLLGVIAFGTVARDRDQSLGFAADRIGFGASGLNPLVDKKLLDEIATQGDTCA